MSVNLHIDRVVLHDIELGKDRPEVLRKSMEQELTRLLREKGVPTALRSGGATDRIAGATPVRMTSKTRALHLGAGIARSTYGGLQR